MHSYTAILSENGMRFADRLAKDFDIVWLPCDREISKAVSSHADMILFALENELVIPRAFCIEHAGILDVIKQSTQLSIIADDTPRGEKYPHDIALNVLICGKFAFSLSRYTSQNVMKLLQKHDITHINVKQGYAACSSLCFDNAVVTADTGIIRAAESVGLETLKISPGFIQLEGLSEGFIGGASGVCENRIYFLGNIESHPDSARIKEHATRHEFECINLSDDALCDLGGIKFIKNVQ